MNIVKFTLLLKTWVFLMFLTSSEAVFSQCNAAGFTATPTNGTCFANGTIDVQVPGASTCANWVAFLTPLVGAEQQIAIPANGGPVTFTGLAAGSYNVRLFDGMTTIQAPNNPIAITTSYVNMNISSTSVKTSCPPSSGGYTPDAQLTVTINSGGVGPYVYSITTAAGTFSTAPIMATSYTFTSADIAIGNAEVVSFTVVDQVNGQPGCATSITQTPTIVSNLDNNTASYSILFSRMCSPNCNLFTGEYLFFPYNNLSTLQIPGNVTISINGGAPQNLTYGYLTNGFIPTWIGDPGLSPGDSYTIAWNDGCVTGSRSGVAPAINNTVLNVNNIISSINGATCLPSYTVHVSGSGQFCPTNSLIIEQEVPIGSGNWVNVPLNPVVVNPLNGNPTFNLPDVGHYRAIGTDDCHSATQEFDVLPPTNTIDLIVPMNDYGSVLEGTGSINSFVSNANALFLTFPMTMQVTPLYPYTNPVTIAPTDPYNLAGNYSINFPVTHTFTSAVNNVAGFTLDLPPGDYQVIYTDACGVQSTPKTVSVTRVTSYDPTIQVNQACDNSNSVTVSANPVNGPGVGSTFEFLYDNGGTPGAVVPGVSNIYNSNLSWTASNIPAGDYFIRYQIEMSLALNTEFSAAANQIFPSRTIIIPIHIGPYQDITINTVGELCNAADPNSGVVSVEISGGTPVYPQTFQLVTNPGGVVVQTYIANDASDLPAIFTGVAVGDYTVISSNSCYTRNDNISVLAAPILPTVQASSNAVCPSSPATTLSINLDPSQWDITWYEGSIAPGNEIATGVSNIAVTPTATTTYFAEFSLNASSGCVSPSVYSSSETVTVNALITQVGTESTTCGANGLSYTLTNTITGTAPLTATGTGAPGTWTDNGDGTHTWVSDAIAAGTDYNVDFQDANACNTLNIAGVAPVCCVFEVTCPTFPTAKIQY